MDWCKLGSTYYTDPAIARAGEAAEVMFTRGLAYCADQETAGRIPKVMLRLLCPTRTQARTDSLIAERLWLEDGDDVVVRSWERWQESHDVAAERRRNDRERQARARAKKRKSQGQSADQSRDKSRDVTDPEVEGEVETPSVSKATRRKPETPCPDIFPPTDAMRAWITGHGISPDQAKRETEKFLEHHRSKDNRFRDWHAAWRKWMAGVNPDRPSSAKPLNPGAALNREMGLS